MATRNADYRRPVQATVISEDAGPMGLLATILQWIQAYAMYL
jgi:hypothetical protein